MLVTYMAWDRSNLNSETFLSLMLELLELCNLSSLMSRVHDQKYTSCMLINPVEN